MVARETLGPSTMSDTTGYELLLQGHVPTSPFPRRAGGRWMW